MAIDPKLAAAKVDNPYPRPSADPTYEEQKPPSPIARGLSKALMQSAFSKFGQAFTDTGHVREDAQTRESRLAPYIAEGGAAAAALEGRWHQMEYENFQNKFVEPFVQQKKDMLDDFQRRHAAAAEGIFEGPDGNPAEIDILTKEGRLKSMRMTNALTKRFFALNADMDLELQNEVGKFSSNPLIVQRGQNIMNAGAAVLANTTNPEGALDAADKESVIRAREAEAEARMVTARGTAAAAKAAKRPVTYDQAWNHPEIGAEGMVRWMRGSPEGLAVLHSPGGGGSFVTEEKKIVEGQILAANPDLTREDPEFEARVQAQEPKYVLAATLKFIASQSPQHLEDVKAATPHFFADEKPKEAGIVTDKRMPPEVREQHVTTWKKHAQDHFNEYMADASKSANIDDAIDDLNEWLHAAIYGDTDEPQLQGVTVARGEGTRRLVEQILEDVPEHIRNWWPKGSGIAREENPEAARTAELLSGKFGLRGARLGRKRQREAKKDNGGLNL